MACLSTLETWMLITVTTNLRIHLIVLSVRKYLVIKKVWISTNETSTSTIHVSYARKDLKLLMIYLDTKIPTARRNMSLVIFVMLRLTTSMTCRSTKGCTQERNLTHVIIVIEDSYQTVLWLATRKSNTAMRRIQ